MVTEQPAMEGSRGQTGLDDQALTDDENSLFVTQPGEIEKDASLVGLTKETKAKSAARAAMIKEENDSDPEDLEDVDDKLGMLYSEQRILQRRQTKGHLKAADVDRLEALHEEIRTLDQKRATLAPPTTRTITQSRHDAAPSRLSRPPSPAIGQKRKPATSAGWEQPQGKKPRRAAPVKAQGKDLTAGQESTRLILEMLQNPDTIKAGQEMAELPILDAFIAPTVEDQIKRFRKQVAEHPDADRTQIGGDYLMLGKARKALRGCYKVVGDKYLVKGMKTPLYAYQFAAAGWMVERERSAEGPKGGVSVNSEALLFALPDSAPE